MSDDCVASRAGHLDARASAEAWTVRELPAGMYEVYRASAQDFLLFGSALSFPEAENGWQSGHR